MNIRHPAKYTNSFMPVFADILEDTRNVLDPFAGTGKIGLLKAYGYKGQIYANEIEKEWLKDNEFNCDVLSYEDAEYLYYPEAFFDAICTSPTYGNRMADHHICNDDSKRNTYTHCLGRQLTDGNTGKMQYGEQYRDKHDKIYCNLSKMIKPGGLFILNVKNHIRKGVEIDVTKFHIQTLTKHGFKLDKRLFMTTPSLRYGANANKRVNGESILVFVKI